MRAFENPKLNNVPDSWSAANAYQDFEAWGFRVRAEGAEAGFTHLDDVTQGGLRVSTRRWAPDGPPVSARRITIQTAPRYSAHKSYAILDLQLSTGKTSKLQTTADADGRLEFTVDGSGHQLSFIGPGTGGEPPVLLPLTAKDKLRLPPQTSAALPLRVYNPRGEAMTEVKIEASSEYPTVQFLSRTATLPKIEPGAVVDLSQQFTMRLTSGNGYFEPLRVQVKLTYDGWHEANARTGSARHSRSTSETSRCRAAGRSHGNAEGVSPTGKSRRREVNRTNRDRREGQWKWSSGTG